MSVRWPRSLILRGERWTVEYVKRIRKRDMRMKSVRVHAKDEGVVVGLCKHLERRILIVEGLHRRAKARVLLHEIKHAYDEDAPLGGDTDLEALCDRFAGDVVDLLRWNDMRWARNAR